MNRRTKSIKQPPITRSASSGSDDWTEEELEIRSEPGNGSRRTTDSDDDDSSDWSEEEEVATTGTSESEIYSSSSSTTSGSSGDSSSSERNEEEEWVGDETEKYVEQPKSTKGLGKVKAPWINNKKESQWAAQGEEANISSAFVSSSRTAPAPLQDQLQENNQVLEEEWIEEKVKSEEEHDWIDKQVKSHMDHLQETDMERAEDNRNDDRDVDDMFNGLPGDAGLFYATKIKGVETTRNQQPQEQNCVMQVPQTRCFVCLVVATMASWCIVGLLAGAILVYFLFSNLD
jgi:hypothetical protein